jgi:hypothetical protein
MNYDKNRGLGRNALGPTKLIEESKQKGTRGLGFTHKEFTNEQAEWDFTDDPVEILFRFLFSSTFCLISIGTSKRRSSLVSI